MLCAQWPQKKRGSGCLRGAKGGRAEDSGKGTLQRDGGVVW